MSLLKNKNPDIRLLLLQRICAKSTTRPCADDNDVILVVITHCIVLFHLLSLQADRENHPRCQLGLYAGAIPGGDEAFLCNTALLDKAVFNASVQHII